MSVLKFHSSAISVLHFETSSTMAKIWQKMKKSPNIICFSNTFFREICKKIFSLMFVFWHDAWWSFFGFWRSAQSFLAIIWRLSISFTCHYLLSRLFLFLVYVKTHGEFWLLCSKRFINLIKGQNLKFKIHKDARYVKSFNLFHFLVQKRVIFWRRKKK